MNSYLPENLEVSPEVLEPAALQQGIVGSVRATESLSHLLDQSPEQRIHF